MDTSKEKSKTRTEIPNPHVTLLEDQGIYKYLGILENGDSTVSKQTKSNLTENIYKRVNLLCKKVYCVIFSSLCEF